MKTHQPFNLLPWRERLQQAQRNRHLWWLWSIAVSMSVAGGCLWYQHHQIMRILQAEWTSVHTSLVDQSQAYAHAAALMTQWKTQNDQWQQLMDERNAHQRALTLVHTVLSALSETFNATHLHWDDAGVVVRGPTQPAASERLVRALKARDVACQLYGEADEVTLTCLPAVPGDTS